MAGWGWRHQNEQYVIRRFWLAPFLLEVWYNEGRGIDFRGKAYVSWRRIFGCLRRSTAEQYIAWHKDQRRAFSP